MLHELQGRFPLELTMLAKSPLFPVEALKGTMKIIVYEKECGEGVRDKENDNQKVG